MIRPLWGILGLLFVALAGIGLVLPVLPTTPLLLVAGACFARSSERLHRWLRDHPRFGTAVRQWQDHGAIPRRAKWIATTMIAASLGTLIALGRLPGWAALIVVPLVGYGLFFIWRRPDGPRAETHIA